MIDVQRKNYTADNAVVSAIHDLQTMDVSLLTNQAKIEDTFLAVIGKEYADIWNSDRDSLIAETKLKIGNDMSTWIASDLAVLQKIMKKAQQEKAKKEKLASVKSNVRNMKEDLLRDRVSAFLDAHPEFCDDFAN